MSHMRRHTGDYKLFCESCGKGFFTQSKLDSHKRKHTGEKPFRCLFSTCLKRFRYKGDLSKHIKRYHPGHTQALTPVPLQEDEMAALANAQQASKHKVSLIVGHPIPNLGGNHHQSLGSSNILSSGPIITSSPSPSVSTLRTVLTTGLRPNQLVLQHQVNNHMQPPTYRPHHNNPGTIIPDADPSLDENLLNMLAADGEEEDDPMLSPSSTAKTLASLSQSNTALVLPNTVFSSKPVSAQEVGVFLQSSGKSTTAAPLQLSSKAVILSSSRSATSRSPAGTLLTSRPFILPQSSTSLTVISPSVVSCQQGVRLCHQQTIASLSQHSTNTSTSSSQTLRSLLSSTPENLPVTQTIRIAPLQPRLVTSSHTNNTILTTTFSPIQAPSSKTDRNSPKMTESFLPADISFTSRSGSTGVSSLPSDAVSLTLEDIMSYAQVPHLKDVHHLGSNGLHSALSDRDSDLTSPGSVRSELEGSSIDGDSEKLLTCQFPGCGRSFDRASLLKRHIKMHSGECRFVCDVCKKSFESGSKLEDHYRRHTGERPFQCHVCGNKFRYKGDRTKHLKNLHGITKVVEVVPSQPSPMIANGSSLSSTEVQKPTTTDNTPFMPSITEETSSSISSFHSNPETLSDFAGSVSGGSTIESPTKFDPLDVGPSNSLQSVQSPITTSSTLNNNSTLGRLMLTGRHPNSVGLPLQETVTMSIDEVMQYAQPIADFTF